MLENIGNLNTSKQFTLLEKNLDEIGMWWDSNPHRPLRRATASVASPSATPCLWVILTPQGSFAINPVQISARPFPAVPRRSRTRHALGEVERSGRGNTTQRAGFFLAAVQKQMQIRAKVGSNQQKNACVPEMQRRFFESAKNGAADGTRTRDPRRDRPVF